MIPQPALIDLITFNETPIPKNAVRLLKIPAVFNALQYDGKGGRGYSSALLILCTWLETRTLEVLASLTLGRTMPERFPASEAQDWHKVMDLCMV